MRKVEASYQILTKTPNMNELQFIEKIGRTCYKSEDKITEDGESAKKFVSMLINRGHEAMIEHWSYIFRCPVYTYESFLNMLNTIEELGYNMFIRTTNMYGRCIVSGNIRAWRDFIRACKATNMTIPDWIYYHLGMKCPIKKLLFNDLLSEDASMLDNSELLQTDCVAELSKDDLFYDDEKLVHYDLTVKFITDRGVSHELVRHRPASYAQESTRYCNYSKDAFGNECTVLDILRGMDLDAITHKLPSDVKDAIYCEWEEAMKDSEKHYLKMLELGATPQIARSVLSSSTKTEIVITANYSEWNKLLVLRTAKAAHPQMREISLPLLYELKGHHPVFLESLNNI